MGKNAKFQVTYKHSVAKGAKDTSLLSVVTDSMVEDSMAIFQLISSMIESSNQDVNDILNSSYGPISDFLSCSKAKLQLLIHKKAEMQRDYYKDLTERDKEKDMKRFQFYFKVSAYLFYFVQFFFHCEFFRILNDCTI